MHNAPSEQSPLAKIPKVVIMNLLKNIAPEIVLREKPIAAISVPAATGRTLYPAPFAKQVRGRTKRKLGDVFALSNFGVNLTQLAPGAASALFHQHTTQDEFIYILEGSPTLLLGEEAFLLAPGECMGFKAGTHAAHQLINQSNETVTYLEIGDRSANDKAHYPNDDLTAILNNEGNWVFTHKDGTPY